jgi:hypothetical protein
MRHAASARGGAAAAGVLRALRVGILTVCAGTAKGMGSGNTSACSNIQGSAALVASEAQNNGPPAGRQLLRWMALM